MVEQSPPLLLHADESPDAENYTRLEPEAVSVEPGPKPPSDLEFACDCEEWMRSACKGLPYYKEHAGRRYCVLHYAVELRTLTKPRSGPLGILGVLVLAEAQPSAIPLSAPLLVLAGSILAMMQTSAGVRSVRLRTSAGLSSARVPTSVMPRSTQIHFSAMLSLERLPTSKAPFFKNNYFSVVRVLMTLFISSGAQQTGD